MSNRSNKLPGNQQGAQPLQGLPNQSLVGIQQTQITLGPLPSAVEFQGYENAVPGTGNKILSMAELEAHERHVNTRWMVLSHVFQGVMVPIFGFVLAGGAIYGGFLLSMAGHDGLGLSAIVAGATSLVGAFVSMLRRPKV